MTARRAVDAGMNGANEIPLGDAQLRSGIGQQRKAVDARGRLHEQRPVRLEFAIRHQPDHVVREGVRDRIAVADLDGKHATAAHGEDVVAKAFDGGTGVENVDVPFVAEAFLLQHRTRGLRVIVNFADNRPCRLRQQVYIDRMTRHQLGDE